MTYGNREKKHNFVKIERKKNEEKHAIKYYKEQETIEDTI